MLPIFPEPVAEFRWLLVGAAVIGLLYGSLLAFRQPDARGVIAYSSIAQMGLVTLGIFALNDQGATGAAFQMVNHGAPVGGAVPARRLGRAHHRPGRVRPPRRPRAR